MSRAFHATVALLACGFAAAQRVSPGDRWTEFRGGTAGRTAAADLPREWSRDSGVAWSVELPGIGQSSPIVFEDRVFVTAVHGEMKELCLVACYRTGDGQLLWCRSFESSTERKLTNTISQAAPTPALDVDRVYAFFESGDFVALSHDGEVQWRRRLTRDYGAIQGNHGLGGSVVVSSRGVHLLIDHEGPSYLLCLDKATGENRWRVERTPRVSWSTPVVGTFGQEELVVVSSNGTLEGFDADDGARRFELGGLVGNTVPSPSIVGDEILVGTSSRGPGAAVVSLGDAASVRWNAEPARPSGFSSPIRFGERVLVLNTAGVLAAYGLADGKLAWRQRLEQGAWASPIVAGDLIYYFGKDGTTSVVRPTGDGAEIVAVNALPTEATVFGVAAVDGRFLVRERDRLFCITGS